MRWCCEYLDYKIEFIEEGIEEKCINKKNGNVIAYIDKKYFRENDVNSLKGDFSKIKNKLNWKPKIFAQEIAQKMIKYDLENEWNNS